MPIKMHPGSGEFGTARDAAIPAAGWVGGHVSWFATAETGATVFGMTENDIADSGTHAGRRCRRRYHSGGSRSPPAEPPFGGVIWSFVVPAILFAVALGATVLLYRHFAGRDR